MGNNRDFSTSAVDADWNLAAALLACSSNARSSPSILYSRVAERHWESVRRTRAENSEKAENEVRSAFEKLGVRGAEPSVPEVMKVISKGPYLWIKNVRLLLKKICQEANSAGEDGRLGFEQKKGEYL
jgi:hypothetical protein